MQESARRIAKVSIESRLPLNEDEYVSSFRVELMDAVMQWCKGAKFVDICKLTDVFEGSIIRAFRRLQELIRQMMQAAKAIGNEELETKFAGSLEKLERQGSIIFSPCVRAMAGCPPLLCKKDAHVSTFLPFCSHNLLGLSTCDRHANMGTLSVLSCAFLQVPPPLVLYTCVLYASRHY